MLASEVTAQAAALLTDPSQSYWSNAILLPMLNKANEELALMLEREELPLILEEQAPNTTVEVGDKQFDEIPTDMVEPIRMWERPMGSTDKFNEVEMVINVDRNLTTMDRICQWAWRNNKIFINPPTTPREAYIDYFRSMFAIDTENHIIELPKAKTWLAIRTAQLSCLHIGNNPTRYNELIPEVIRAEDILLRTMGKRVQGAYGVRRRPYKGAMGRRSTLV